MYNGLVTHEGGSDHEKADLPHSRSGRPPGGSDSDNSGRGKVKASTPGLTAGPVFIKLRNKTPSYPPSTKRSPLNPCMGQAIQGFFFYKICYFSTFHFRPYSPSKKISAFYYINTFVSKCNNCSSNETFVIDSKEGTAYNMRVTERLTGRAFRHGSVCHKQHRREPYKLE